MLLYYPAGLAEASSMSLPCSSPGTKGGENVPFKPKVLGAQGSGMGAGTF